MKLLTILVLALLIGCTRAPNISSESTKYTITNNLTGEVYKDVILDRDNEKRLAYYDVINIYFTHERKKVYLINVPLTVKGQ